MVRARAEEVYDELSASLDAEGFAAKGMTLLGSCENVTAAFEARCLRVSHSAGG
jgi:hypothetical protein